MRRVSPAALAATPSRLVVRRAWWAYVPLAAMLALGCTVWGALAWHVDAPLARLALTLLFAFVLALFVLVAGRIVKLRGDANWLLRLTDGALILNHADEVGRPAAEPVELPFGEILSARRIVEKRVGVGDHTIEDVHDTQVYLELGLADVDSSPLAGFRPPIVLVDSRTLRIGWRDRTTRLTPSLAVFVAALPPTVARAPDWRTEWHDSRLLSDEAFRERVHALCAGNDELGAIKVVRLRYKLGLREAKDLVERLSMS